LLSGLGLAGGPSAAGTAVTGEQGGDDAQATATLSTERHLSQRIGEQSRDRGVIVAAIGHGERHGITRDGDVQLVRAGSVQAGIDDELLDRQFRVVAPAGADLQPG